MSANTNAIMEQQVPAASLPTPNPGTLNSGRDLAAEKESELRQDQQASKAKQDRFRVKKPSSITTATQSSNPEFETLMLKGAVNQPLPDLVYPAISTFVPNMHVFFYILHVMDHLMCSTKRWFDNSFGWAPPISQMYFTVLVYYQIFKAMDATGNANQDMINFLIIFERTFSPSELWIPGPLVSAFRALSAFRPDANDLFGGVTPFLPETPGWSKVRNYLFDDDIMGYIPNLSYFISRLRLITAAASATHSDAEFYSRTDGPIYIESICGSPMLATGNTNIIMQTPGTAYGYSGSRQLWLNAYMYLDVLNIPANLNQSTTEVSDTWTAAMRFEDNEHVWFGNISAVMAKYSQFFNGSTPLSEIAPVNSAAGSIKVRFSRLSTFITTPTFYPEQGNHNTHSHGDAQVVNHYATKSTNRAVLDAQCAVRDLPDAHMYSGLTYAYNGYFTRARQNANRLGKFWELGPNVKSGTGIEIIPSLPAIIMRDYHNDTRIPAVKQ